MVANRATAEVVPGNMAREMANNMEQLAKDGQWDGVERIAARLRSVILEVPESERREIMELVNYALERVRTHALTSRGEIASKLSEIRRGRDAARAYGGSLAPRQEGQGQPR